MSDIKFFHCNDLRLGSALPGLINSPSWLQTLAENAFRQATRNLIDQAIARQVHFVLISGSICDSSEDLISAVHWLTDERRRLNKRGIRLVLSAPGQHQAEQLSPAADHVIRPHEFLHVRRIPQLRLNVAAESDRDAELSICQSPQRPSGSPLVYEVRSPADRSQVPRSRSDDGCLAAAAGCVQVTSSDETAPGGVLLVEAHPATRFLRAEPVSTDVLRFTERTVHVKTCDQSADIVEELLRRSQDLAGDFDGTTVVDWAVETQLHTSSVDIGAFRTEQLLQSLQTRLHGGHRGVWARRIRYTADSTIQHDCTDSLFGQLLRLPQDNAEGAVATMRCRRLDDVLIEGLALLQKAA